MIEYFFKKYWIGLLMTVVFIAIGWASEGNFNDGMFLASCLGILTTMLTIIFSAKFGSLKTSMTIFGAIVNIGKWIWYVISLKPLRRWIIRQKVKGASPEPYPYLALYGSLTDTMAMKANYSSAFWHDKTPAVRAAIWRLLSRRILEFGLGPNDSIVFTVGKWSASPSSGVDQALEYTIYNFMRQSVTPQGFIDIKLLYKVISYHRGRKNNRPNCDLNNQFRFAEILSTGISRQDYNEQETRNIYGMKKFLDGLPSSFEQLTGEAAQLDLQRVWNEYMAYAYLFGIEKSTFNKLLNMIPQNSYPPLLNLLSSSDRHRRLLRQLMQTASNASRYADDAVSINRGRLKQAWHAEELYDISTN